MCYHKSQKYGMDVLADYYSASYTDVMKEVYGPTFHENAYNFLPLPIITAENPGKLMLYNWGLIPHWVKDRASGFKLRTGTLNCVSEEMYDKPSFRDPLKGGQRCLIPCSGFFESQWKNPQAKTSDKFPYFIFLKDQPLFSFAGLYSQWTDRSTGDVFMTYTVLTTVANSFMERIHNTKKRQPVIIPREYERDWLNKNLTKDDVLAFCRPIESERMDAYPVSKLIHARDKDTNVEAAIAKEFYPQLNSD
jgi:putative SOS response-associated peptidase YedK